MDIEGRRSGAHRDSELAIDQVPQPRGEPPNPAREESLSRDLAAVAVPALVTEHFKLSFGVKDDASHPRLKSFARTSSQGIVLT